MTSSAVARLNQSKPPASSLVLITGGGGYVGAALARHLLEAGWRVRVLEVSGSIARTLRRRISPPGKAKALEIRVGDVCNPADVRRACKGATHLIHLAGIANVNACRAQPQRAIEINGFSTRNLLEAARESKGFRRFIYPSSVAGMYTVPQKGKIVEASPVFPVDDYGISKYLGEQFCRAYSQLFGLPTTIFRQSNVYGPSPFMKFDNVVHIFARKALAGEELEIHGKGNQERDFVYLDDLVRAYEFALQSDIPPGREFNICSGKSLSIRQVAEEIRRAVSAMFGKRVEMKFIPMGEREIEIRRFAISGKRALLELGFAASTSFSKGVRRLLEGMVR